LIVSAGSGVCAKALGSEQWAVSSAERVSSEQ
jgi:hypothetical protein